MRPLAMYMVYYAPADFPGLYVVRKFTIAGPDRGPDPELCFVGHSLEAARAAIPPEAKVCLPRSPDNEASIVETWFWYGRPPLGS